MVLFYFESCPKWFGKWFGTVFFYSLEACCSTGSFCQLVTVTRTVLRFPDLITSYHTYLLGNEDAKKDADRLRTAKVSDSAFIC